MPRPITLQTNTAKTKPADILNASAPDTLTALHVVAEIGLAPDEVAVRRKQYGYNEVAITKSHPFLVFLGKFWGLSAWMLELIIVLSAVLGNIADLVMVSVLLVVNAVLSYTQERRATGVVAALRKRLQVSARVRRESVWQVIPSRELVPGDIIRLRSGDIIPADIKLLTGLLAIDQSAMTGESRDVDKAPGDVLSSGSIVWSGEGNGVVIVTGAKTYLGRTTELVQKAQPKLHIEAVIAKVVLWLFLIVGLLLSVVVGLIWMHDLPFLQIAPLLLVLLMSAVPVALPVMFTVSMALGSKDLAKRGVLVTRLSAVEDAATMDVLCVDKTGTITMNQLAISGVIPVGNASEASILYAGLLASKESNQDPIDLAFVAAVKERHLYDQKPLAIKGTFVPFDAKNRRTEALFEQNGQRMRVMKGAVETLTQFCGPLPPAIAALVAASSAIGYRTLAVAQGPEAGPFMLLGLVTLNDPPRPDAKQLIAELKDLGVAVKMLTGDALPVANAIGQEVGLPCIHRMADLKVIKTHTTPQVEDFLAGVDGLAEVFPEDKYRVVQQMQTASHITGMTGDGVNDAPALRQAEVGIAVSTATDVAKGAASVVLTEAGLTNIVALIRQGRAIYQRILTWIINKISRTILKAAYVAIAFVATGQFVISAFGMLLLVFVTDFAVITLATDHVRPSKKPETWKIGGFVTVSVALGIAMLAESLLLLWIAWTYFGLSTNNSALNTFSFLLLLYFAVFSIISVRERSWFWATLPSTLLLATLAAEALAGTLLTFFNLPGLEPLLGWQALAIFVYAMLMCLGINDILKVVMIKWLVLKRGADVRQVKSLPSIAVTQPVVAIYK
jgi:H+-transporting ATPase